MAWSESVHWVDNRYKWFICNHVKKYSSFTPYDLDDFIQEAYIAAYDASQKFPVGSPSFCTTFWNNYKNIAKLSLATNPNFGKIYNFEEDACPEARTAVNFESFDELKHSNYVKKENNSTAISNEDGPPTDIHRTLIKLAKHLLKNQVDVYITVLGLRGNGALNFTEAATLLNRDKHEVSKIFNNCCNRLQRLIEKGTIKTDSFPRMALVAITGRKTSDLQRPSKTPSVCIQQNLQSEQNLRLVI